MMPNKSSIRFKLTLSIILVSVLFTAIVISAQFYLEYKTEKKIRQEHAQSHVVTLIAPISEALWDLDFEQLDALLLVLKNDAYLTNVSLKSLDGTTITVGETNNNALNVLSYDLFYDSHRLGELNYTINHDRITEKIYNELYLVIWATSIKTLLMVLIIFALIERLITSRLRAIQTMAQKVAKHSISKLSIPALISKTDGEIYEVAQAMKKMNESARQALAGQKIVERQLRQHKAKLESIVSEKTEAFKRQTKINRILADMSLDIITTENDNSHQIIVSALAPLGELLHVDSMSIIELDKSFANYKHSWFADDNCLINEDQFDISDFQFLRRRLLSLTPIVFNNVDELEELAPMEYKLLKGQDIASIAVLPLIDGRRIFGLLTVSHLHTPKQWSDDKLSVLSRFATAISEVHIRTQSRLAMHQLQQDLINVNKRLKIAADTDELTGLPNRRPFKKELEQLLESSYLNSIAVIMIDIDFFKKYNDHYGHVQGDFALRYVARELSNVMKPCGHMAARIGGEEFAAVMADVTIADVEALGKKLCTEIENLSIEHTLSDCSSFLTISVGACYISCDEIKLNSHQLLEYADKALYLAKEHGRNRFEINFPTREMFITPKSS